MSPNRDPIPANFEEPGKAKEYPAHAAVAQLSYQPVRPDEPGISGPELPQHANPHPTSVITLWRFYLSTAILVI